MDEKIIMQGKNHRISDIKEELKSIQDGKLDGFIKKYDEDTRSGVVKLVDTAKKRMEKYEDELLRTENLKKYEKQYKDYGYICGIDEVGRGPLAGPVVACAVILPVDCDILYINDSKKLSAKKRNELYDVIMEKAVSVGIGMASHERIDEINILNATKLGVKKAIEGLEVKPDLILIDALTHIETHGIPYKSIIKGDAKEYSIAAASIIAKVTRDRMMLEWDKVFPEYGFAKHKGYGTAAHIQALKEYGPCMLHRRSFIKNFI